MNFTKEHAARTFLTTFSTKILDLVEKRFHHHMREADKEKISEVLENTKKDIENYIDSLLDKKTKHKRWRFFSRVLGEYLLYNNNYQKANLDDCLTAIESLLGKGFIEDKQTELLDVLDEYRDSEDPFDDKKTNWMGFVKDNRSIDKVIEVFDILRNVNTQREGQDPLWLQKHLNNKLRYNPDLSDKVTYHIKTSINALDKFKQTRHY